MDNKKEPLHKLIGDQAYRTLSEQILKHRKVSAENVTYDAFDYQAGGLNLLIRPEHVPVDDVIKHAKSGCRDCNSNGYTIVNIPKVRLPDPGNRVILSDRKFKGASEEERKKIIDEEIKKTTWRVMDICRCATMQALMADGHMLATQDRTIFVRVDYDIKPPVVTE
jgi:hypothetical protein